MTRTLFKPLDDTSDLVIRSDVKILSINNKSHLFNIGDEADYKFIPIASKNFKKDQIEFVEIISDKLFNNLLLLSSDLPKMTAYLLKISYEQRVKKLSNIVEKLIQQNPLSYPTDSHHPFYTYKLKKMLLAMVQGMGDDFPKTGVFETSFLQLRIKINDKSIIYHVYDMQQLAELLLMHSYLSPHPTIHYNKNGEKYITLNLQIHF